jgi:hypothetical protein
MKHTVTCRPISRQFPKYVHATVSQEGFSMWFTYIHCDNRHYSQSAEMRVQAWSVKQQTTEESPLVRFVTRKRLVKTLQRYSHCGELLLSKD